MMVIKRLMKAALILLIAVSALCSCGKEEKRQTEGLTYWILDEFSPSDGSGVHQIPGMMGGWMYVDDRYPLKLDEYGNSVVPDVCVLYTVTAWPDFSDGNKVVTRIDISDPGVSVFGVTLDTEADEFENIMSENGLYIADLYMLPPGVEQCCRAESPDGSYHIVLETLTNGEKRFYINAPVTNRKGILF